MSEPIGNLVFGDEWEVEIVLSASDETTYLIGLDCSEWWDAPDVSDHPQTAKGLSDIIEGTEFKYSVFPLTDIAHNKIDSALKEQYGYSKETWLNILRNRHSRLLDAGIPIERTRMTLGWATVTNDSITYGWEYGDN